VSAWVYVAAIAACVAGALLRYELAVVGRAPWSTLIANAIGALVLGVVVRLAITGEQPELLLIAGAGFAGGLSTFSTLAVEIDGIWREGRRRFAVEYSALTLGVGLVAAWLGWALGS
jgi:CrcB protein